MNTTAKILLAAVTATVVPCMLAQSSPFSNEDKTFLQNSVLDDVAEVKLAKLALQTSKDATVTTFAKKMLDDHQRLLGEEKPVADKASVTTPEGLNPDGDAEYLKLRGLSGAAFDKTYIQMMKTDNHKNLEAATSEHEKTHNEDMRRLAARTQEMVASQVEMVDRIAAKMGV